VAQALPSLGPIALARVTLVLATLASAALALAFPSLTGRVVDAAGIIPEPVRASLTETLKTLEDKSGIQLVVATVDSLQGEEIEPYANALFRHWRLGETAKNNGVLLLVAPKQRRVRIEVGYGLEGTLTDALAKIIITNAIAPRFKAGDFGGGIERGVDDVITVLTTDASEWQKRPELRVDRHDTTADAWAPFIALALFLLIVFLLIRAPRTYVAGVPRSRWEMERTGRWGPGPLDAASPRGSRWDSDLTDPRTRRSGWGDFLAFLLWVLSQRRDGGGGGWGSGSGGFGDSGGGFSGGGGSSGGGGASGSW
jgi:uncharacterized protein